MPAGFRAYSPAATVHLPVVLGVLGVLSALASVYVPGPGFEMGRIRTPVLPGIYFGLVVAVGVWLAAAASPARLLAVVAVVLAAWLVAVQVAEVIYFSLTNVAEPQKAAAEPLALYLGGCAAGAVGAAITLAGAAIGASRLRSAKPFLATILAGAAAGLLLRPAISGSDEPLLLYVPWQVLVAATIGLFLKGNSSAADGP